MELHSNYKQAGVDYGQLDDIKRRAIELARTTATFMQSTGAEEDAGSRGSSAYVFRIGTLRLATVIEGLGTKSTIASDYYDATGELRYHDIAQDAVAAILNDVSSVGAVPMMVTAYFATGSSGWYSDTPRALDLLAGWQSACANARVTWGGGESPTLPSLIQPDGIELAGSAIGVIPEGREPVYGRGIAKGDAIVLLASSGLHANGASLVAGVVARSETGLLTRLPSGRTLGEALLDPTHLYSPFVTALLEADVTPKFLNAITGHGFLKIMRAPAAFHYRISKLPHVPEALDHMRDRLSLDDKEAYSTLNMGAGYVVIVAERDADEVLRVARDSGQHAIVAGQVEAGPRSLSIEPLGVSYTSSDLDFA